MKRILIIAASISVVLFASCKKDYLDTIPSDAATEEQLFSNYNSVIAALNGIYKSQFTFGESGSHDDYGQKSTDLMYDLMGNDMVVHSQGYGWYNADYQLTAWLNAVNFSQSDNTWTRYYAMIKQCNKIIANADKIEGATEDQKASIKGQAFGLRGYAYYYLINYFQQTYKGNEALPGVPIYLEDTTGGKPRGTVQMVFDQIKSDFSQAEQLLMNKGRESKVNMDVSVINGFKARVALLENDWATAATNADLAIGGGYSLMDAATYVARSSFSTIENSECMWGSKISSEEATIYASFFSHMDISTGGYAALGGQKKITKWLYDKMADGDVRKEVFTAPGTGTTSDPDYDQHKFQVPDIFNKWQADYQYMKVSEMYLIKAEGLARQGKDAEAITALETLVKARYPAYSASGLSGQSLIDEILLQRRIELWGEGYALWDIKRLGQGLNRPTGIGNHGAPSFNPNVYTTAPQDPRFLMRIPDRELNNNASMTPADQNPQ